MNQVQNGSRCRSRLEKTRRSFASGPRLADRTFASDFFGEIENGIRNSLTDGRSRDLTNRVAATGDVLNIECRININATFQSQTQTPYTGLLRVNPNTNRQKRLQLNVRGAGDMIQKHIVL